MPAIVRGRRLVAAALPLVAVLVAAATAGGAATKKTWFGSSLNHEPANAGSTCPGGGSCARAGSFYPGTSGRMKSPLSGKIVRFRIRAQGPMTARLEVVRLRKLSSDHRSARAKLVSRGPRVKVKGGNGDEGTYPIESFKTHLKVHKGDIVAIETSRNMAEYCSDGTPGELTFASVRRGSFRNSNSVVGCLLLVQAVVKRG